MNETFNSAQIVSQASLMNVPDSNYINLIPLMVIIIVCGIIAFRIGDRKRY